MIGFSGIQNVAHKIGNAANTLGSSQAFGAAPPPQSLTPAQATGSPVASQGPGFGGVRQLGDTLHSWLTSRAAAKHVTPLGASDPAQGALGGIGTGAPLGRGSL